MLAKRIIPCLDVKDGRCVKGVNFVSLRDAGDPVDQARLYDEQGADELVFLDISATPEGRATVAPMVRRVADQVFLPLTVGGGIRSVDDMRAILLAGADKVGINSAAVRTPELISAGADKFGSQCIVVSIDARRRPGADAEAPAWEVVIAGGRTGTGLDADGTHQGYDLALTRAIAAAAPVPVIASGGAGRLEDFADVFLDGAADAALAASLFHDGILTVRQVKYHLAGRGIAVRLV